MITTLININLLWSIVAGASVAIRSKLLDAERLKNKFTFKWPTYKSKKDKSISEIFKLFTTALLFLIPLLNIGITIVTLLGNDEAFDKIFKEIQNIFCTVKENPEYVKEIKAKKAKKKFNIKNLLKKKEIKKDKEETLKEDTPEKPKDTAKEDTPEKPKEETKPFVRTALQPEGQLPFEIVWENDHVYSGTVRSLKR